MNFNRAKQITLSGFRILRLLPVLVLGSCSTIFMIRTEYASNLSSRSYAFFFIGSHSSFDPPKADKCLLASGELDVRCSMFIFQFPSNP